MSFNFNYLDQPFVTIDQSGSFTTNNSIGVLLPFNTAGGGLFRKSYLSEDQAKTNLINLLSTKKTERLYHADFGTDLHKILFEQISDTGELEATIRSSIVKALEIWTPYLVLRSLKISNTPTVFDLTSYHTLKIELSVTFEATQANINVVIFINEQGNIIVE